MNLPKISAVMCTYGRFAFVERQLNCFLNQTYPNKELIIYNTDVESPYFTQIGSRDGQFGGELESLNVHIINCNIDKVTEEPYTNVGAIRRDALEHATGDYYICWDDDDVHMPWFMQQGFDRIQATGLPFFKPEQSFFYSGDNLRLVTNTMEASVLCDMNKVKEYGFLLETGKEGLGWYTKARDNKELDEHDTYYIPAYCFDWNSNPNNTFIHRQSGDIENPQNFINHKAASKDAVSGRLLQVYDGKKMREIYKPYFDFIDARKADFPQELLDKYFSRYGHPQSAL
jgi:glycosyltransferase involved in cell wall biosynthesis